MKIRMKALAAGPAGVFKIGDEPDVDARTARAFVDGGYAEYAQAPAREDVSEPEAAVTAPPEKAVMPRPKPRRK